MHGCLGVRVFAGCKFPCPDVNARLVLDRALPHADTNDCAKILSCYCVVARWQAMWHEGKMLRKRCSRTNVPLMASRCLCSNIEELNVVKRGDLVVVITDMKTETESVRAVQVRHVT